MISKGAIFKLSLCALLCFHETFLKQYNEGLVSYKGRVTDYPTDVSRCCPDSIPYLFKTPALKKTNANCPSELI